MLRKKVSMRVNKIGEIRGGYAVLLVLLLGPVVLVVPLKNEVTDCGDVPKDECLKKLQTFLRLKSLPFPKEERQLNKLCSDTVSGYNCSSRLFAGPNCIPTEDKDTIPVFVEMAQYSMIMFCSSGDGHGYLRERMLKHSECINNQKDALDCCSEKSNLMDLPVMHFLDQSGRTSADRQIAACCPVASYLKCVQTVIIDKCGKDAGNFTVEYIRRASGEQLESICQRMPGYPEPNEEMCKTPSPVCSGSRATVFVEMAVLMNLLFAIWIYNHV